MKKIFTIALVALIAMTTNARKWDFTNWSAATKTALLKGAGAVNPANGWSDIEKNTGTAPTEVSANNCFWEVTAQGNANAGAQLKADDQVIAELDGLLYTNTTARSLAIAVNYQVANPSDAAFGPYKGPSYLWLGSSKKNYLVIPNVAAGTTIKAGVESHKTTDARGIELYVVKKGAYGTKGSKLNDPNGAAVSAPTTYQDQQWLLNEDALTDADKAMANEDGTYDILIYNTNGCHLYYLEVVEGKDITDKNIAYITGIADYDNEDYFYITMTGMTGFNWTVYNENSTGVTAETLREFDAVVLGPSVSSSSVLGQLVQQQLSFMPIVNFNTGLFGYQPVQNESVYLTALDQENPILEGVEFDGETFTYFDEYSAPAVALPTNFASDKVVAVAGENMDAVMIHQHNANRNSYVFINSEAGEEGIGIDYDAWAKIAENAMRLVAGTKKAVTAAATPTISCQYGDGETTVSVSCGTAGATIYVSVNGGDYAVYSEALKFTEAATVKAYATAEGYNQSAEAQASVIVKTQMAKPIIIIKSTTEKATVTIEAAEGAKVYYNFSGSASKDESALYTEPFDITTVQTTTVYAFATSDVMLDSEIASAEATLEVTSDNAAKVRLDEIAHLDFNETDCFTNVDRDYLIATYGASGTSSAFYYWGKSAWNYYKLDEDGQRINQGTEEEPVYIPNPESVRTIAFGTDWIMKSAGQTATLEYIASAGGLANGRTGRYAAAIEDLVAGEPSKGLIDFGGKTSGDPYSMSFETTAKYAGPFDIVTYLGNGSTSDLGIEAQVSKDGETWETVGALNYTTSQRYWKRTKLSYEGTDEVYVRVAQVSGGSKGQIYDIILLNNGEKSKEYTPVIEREAEEAVVNQNRVVAKGGQLFIETVDGKVITIAAQRVK